MIVITDDYYGGEQGFKSILNDYYENALNDLPESDQTKARKFIEEGLIVAGRRVGMTEGVEKTRYHIDAELLERLLDSRLIRAEITHLGRSFEVSHDTLVEPIVKSYEIRRQYELEQERLAELRKTRRRYAIATGVAVMGIGLATTSTIFYIRSRNANIKIEAQRVEIQNNLTQIQENLLGKYTSDYDGAVNTGRALMEGSNYGDASEQFLIAKQAILEYTTFVGDSLAYKIDNNGSTAAALLAEANEKGKDEIAFKNLLREAENFERQGPQFLVDAKGKILEALNMNYNNQLARERLGLINKALEVAFQRFTDRGELYYENAKLNPTDRKAWEDALEQFNFALRINPDDAYTQGRVAECQENLN